MLCNPDIERIEKYGYLEDIEIIGYCDKCKEEIQTGYEVYQFDGETFCEECFDEFLDELKKHCLIKY